MKSIQVFHTAGSHPTTEGIFLTAANWARTQGAQLEVTAPDRSAPPAALAAFLARSGVQGLPLTLLDGEVALAGRFPTRAELARWSGLTPTDGAGHCCSGGACGG